MARLQSAFDIARESGALGAVTDRTLAGLRLVLSVSAFLIIVIDPYEPSRLENLTHFALVAYIVYAAAIYAFMRHRKNFPFRMMQLMTWLDVVWYSVLITLGTGTNAVFFFFYLFAIIAGSSRGGTRLGLMLTVVCTSIFFVLNVVFIQQLQLDVTRFARRTVYMGVLGYILAYWGGAEAKLRRRLTFLKEMSLIANPRLGVDRTIGQTLRRVLSHFRADYALLLIDSPGGEFDLYRVSVANAESESRPLKVRDTAGLPLMSNSDGSLGVYVERKRGWQGKVSYRVCDPRAESIRVCPYDAVMEVAERMNVRSFVTVPLRSGDRIRGRVFVGTAQHGRFDIEDATFLLQAMDQVLPFIENIRLVDRLASGAAEEERRRIARSVHDRVIQPYLGLQIGIKALQQELSRSGFPSVSASADRAVVLLDRLVGMTKEGVEELREYVNGLKNLPEGELRLSDLIRQFSTKFEDATGIHVNVVSDTCRLTMRDRLSIELFQMTTEALSNIHRHTEARVADVRLSMSDNRVELSIENESGETPRAFRPSSIVERADALGARTEILWPAGKTLVRVEVPL